MGAGVKAAEHAPTLLLQVSTSLCRVWITLIKLSYALIHEGLLRPNMQHHESLCGRLLPSALRVSEKNSSRKLSYAQYSETSPPLFGDKLPLLKCILASVLAISKSIFILYKNFDAGLILLPLF